MVIKQWHPAAEAFPLMQGEKFQEFLDDIRAHGVLKPLEFYDGDRWPEFKGVGIDGRNRQKACTLLNLDPPVIALTDADVGDSLTSYIASANIKRRQLNTSQAAVVALELEKQFAAENAENIKAGQEKGRRTQTARAQENPSPQRIGETDSREKDGNKNIDACTNIRARESAQQAATAVGTNRQYVLEAKKIAKVSWPLLALVRDDQLTIPQAKSVVKQREAHSEAFAALEKGQIDHRQFRAWCFLKSQHAALWNEFRRGQITCEEAVKKARKLTPKKWEDAPVPRGEEYGAQPDGRWNYLAKEGEPTDRLNRPLGGDMLTVFADLAEFSALIASFGACRSKVGQLAARQAFASVDCSALNEQLGHFQEHLQDYSPYCVCPSCSGMGQRPGDKPKSCPTCGGKGFICEVEFQNLNDDLQEVANGYK